MPNVFMFFEWADKNKVKTAEWSDLGIIIGSCFVQLFLYLIVKKTCRRYIYISLDDKYQGDDKLERVARVVRYFYDELFYTTTTFFAFYAFANTVIIPKSFFGSGECSNLFSEYPNKPSIPYLNEFYLYQLGNHLYRLINHAATARHEARFYEMFLHHYVTFALIFYSYLFNYTHHGAMTMILHDFGDIFLCGLRAYDSFKIKIKVVWYFGIIGTLITWIYSRILFLPGCMINACFGHIEDLNNGLYHVSDITKVPFAWLTGLLFVLLILHTYWLFALVYVCWKSLTKKSIKLSANPKRQLLLKEDKDN